MSTYTFDPATGYGRDLGIFEGPSDLCDRGRPLPTKEAQMPFVRTAICQFCGDENEHVEMERHDGSIHWLCQGDSSVILACARRRFGPFTQPDGAYSMVGIGGYEASLPNRR